MDKIKNILGEDIRAELAKAMYPEISHILVNLGMIEDIKIKGAMVSVTLALPFLSIPIKKSLINLIKEAIIKLNKDMIIEIKTVEMTEGKREKFLQLATEGWKI